MDNDKGGRGTDNKQQDVFKKIMNSLKRGKKAKVTVKSNLKLVKLDY